MKERGAGFRSAPLRSIAVLFALFAGTLPSLAQSTDPPAGTLTRLPNLPNYFYPFWDALPANQRSSLISVVNQTHLIGDPANGVVFQILEAAQSNCMKKGQPGNVVPVDYSVVAYDLDTYELRNGICAPWLSGDDRIVEATGGSALSASLLVSRGSGDILAKVGSADRVLFFSAGGQRTNDTRFLTPGHQTGAVVVVSQESLDTVAAWALPDSGLDDVADQEGDALPTIRGMSWYEPENQLLVLSEFWQNNVDNDFAAPQGLTLTAYDVKKGLKADVISKPKGNFDQAVLWTVRVPGCRSAIFPDPYVADPYRSTRDPSAVYVPCVVEGKSNSQHEKVAVVKLKLGPDGKPRRGLDGQPVNTLTPVPSPATSFLFDPGSDRGFLSPKVDHFLVYDGASAEFLGRSRRAQSVALDVTTGRLYMSKPGVYTLVDGRRTPLNPGILFPALGSGVSLPYIMPVIPPTPSHPYTRWISNDQYDHPEGKCSNCELPYFTVIADTIPVTVDPPLSELDAGTFLGEIPPGGRIELTYGGTARAFGIHSNLVGGFGGIVSNITGVESNGRLIPIMSGSRNVLAGALRKVSQSSEESSGLTAALADANNVSSSDYQRCSDPESAIACLWPPIPALGPPPGGPPAPGQGQRWPYPDAACAQPGPTQKQERAGYYATDENGNYVTDENGNGVPGTQRSSLAEVNCWKDDSLSAFGKAFYEGMGTRIEGFPSVFSGSAEALAWVDRPADGLGNPTVATARAYARNVTIGFEPAQVFSIGEVSHEATAEATGRPDTGAKGESTVHVRNIVVGGQLVCEWECSEKDFEEINRRFAGRMRIVRPVEDPVWSEGSPGGFTAAVQTHPTQRYGDIRFHGASEEEAAILPGLRIILYNDGPVGLSRQVVDLAGVYVDARLGVELLPEPPPATVKINLTDDADPPNPLGGGTFEVFSDKNADGAIDELVDTLAVDALSGQAALCVTGADGSGNCSFRLSRGSYVVHELNPPPGYSAAPDYPPEGETFTLEQGLEYTVNFVNLKALGGIEISLTDGSDPLKGGKFSVVADEDRDGTLDSSEAEVANCTTDDEGGCAFDEVAFGAYIVSQQKAPDGYAPSTTPISFAIDEPREIAKVDFVNLPAIGLIKVTLKDDSPEAKAFAGGVFDIYADNGDRSLGSADQKIATCTTDLGGRCALKSSEVASRPGFWVAPDCPGEAAEVLECAKGARSGPPPEGPSLVSPFGTYLVHQQSAPGELLKAEEDVAFALAEPGQVAQVDFVNGPKGASGTVGLSRPGRSATQGVSYEIEEVPPPSVTSEEAPSNEGPNTILRILRLPAEGLQLLVRDPGQAAVVGAVLSLLLLPLLVSRRRRLWLQITTQT